MIGACICNPGLSKVFFGQFEDDALYSRTLSLLSFITVSEMLLNKVSMTKLLRGLFLKQSSAKF